jgi:hypothetical protein
VNEGELMADRPIRSCDMCPGVDDHPRHVAKGVLHHHDCGAANGCVTCQETEAANEGRRGQELIDHLEATRETSDG